MNSEPFVITPEEFAVILANAFAEKSCAPPGSVIYQGRVIRFCTAYGQTFEAYVYEPRETLTMPLDVAAPTD